MLIIVEIQQLEYISVTLSKYLSHMIKLAILASGNGTNAQQISEYFAASNSIKVDCVIYNRKDAFVAERAKRLNIPAHYFGRKAFYEDGEVLRFLQQREIDWVILAGFLWLVPQDILAAFPDRIINIHPALLPNYGGAGMYGHHVHEAVIANHEKESGITIHMVDKQYDHGRTLFQAKCQITEEDTPDSLAAKIHLLEKEYFPQVIERTLLS